MYSVTETLLASERRIIYRGTRDADEQRVLLEVLGPRHALPRDVERLERERRIAEELAGAGAPRPLGLDRFQGLPALVYEDLGGRPLAALTGPLEVDRFLRLAVPIAEALAQVHRQGILHKDLQPGCLLVDEEAGRAWIIDFGISGAGTYAYLAPEQTGRLDRPVDHRADLYALGITFYQALAGRLPFVAEDPVGWIHCHVARAPRPLEGSVPAQVARLLMKLLAKNAAERYQSAAGLARDLARCRADWQASGRIEGFPLAERDGADHPVAPTHLHGRLHERATLRQTWRRITAGGAPEVLLLRGPAGAGKTSLAHELQEPVLEAGGRFLAGKFDPLGGEVPYSTVVQAVRQVVGDLLAESDAHIASWRQRLLGALRGNGRLITDLVPQLTLILGEQPPVEELSPADARQRFSTVLRDFVAAFAAREHPVVLFLDDLQWADPASLRLLVQLAGEDEPRGLLLLGAYRDNEVGEEHPLALALAELQRAARLQTVALPALAAGDLRDLVGDMFGRGLDDEVEALGALVHDRTGGNPLFAIEFLTTLWKEGLAAREAESGRWRWDLARAAARPTTANVVDLLLERLQRLPPPLQELLKYAAVVGDLRHRAILAVLCRRRTADIEKLMAEAAGEGMFTSSAGAYRFAHDRVRQAAGASIPEEERPQVHLRVGRLLLAHTPEAERAEAVFEIVSHLNRGAARIEHPAELEELAELNLTSGLKAKAASAYRSALGYLVAGVDLLRRAAGEADPDAAWSTFYRLTHPLELAAAECELLDGDVAGALARARRGAERARTPREKVRAFLLQRDAHNAQGQPAEAVAAEVACLALFGIDLPATPTEADVAAAQAHVQELLGDRPIEAIADLPLIDDPDLQAALQMTSSAVFTNPLLFRLHAARLVALSLQRGNAEGSVFWYGCHGFILAGMDQIETGHRFATAALALADKHGFTSMRGQARFCLAQTAFWARPLAEARAHTAAALEAWRGGGLSTGVALATLQEVQAALVAGEPLDRVAERAQIARDRLRRLGFRYLEDICALLAQMIRALQGHTSGPGALADAGFDEVAFAARIEPGRLRRATCLYHLVRARLQLLAGDGPAALPAIEEAAALAWTVAGNLAAAELTVTHALVLASVFERGTPAERERWMLTLTGHQARLGAWAEANPASFHHLHALVRAEIARLTGRLQEATEHYQASLEAAAAGGFVQDEALAYELAAGVREAQGLTAMADLYRMEARARYLRWGATGKVRALDRRYPHLAAETSVAAPAPVLINPQQIDLLSVIKASQAISREVIPRNLLHTMMEVLLAQSGATAGVLLLPRAGSLAVEAMARVEGDRLEVRIDPALADAKRPPLPESILRFSWRTREAVVLDDACAERRFADDGYVRGWRPRSVLCLPVFKQTELAALLYLENRALPGVFTPERVTTIGVLAGQTAISLENSRLFQRLSGEVDERKRAEASLRFLADAGDTLAETLDYDATLNRLARLAADELADWCVLDVLESPGEVRRVAAAHRDPAREPSLLKLREEQARNGPPRYAIDLMERGVAYLVFPDLAAALAGWGYDAASIADIGALGSRSALLLAMRARGRLLGTMALVSAAPFSSEGPATLTVAQELARRAAVAVDNARLYREAQEAIRLRDEFLTIASHELNTPLATLRLMVEGLQDGILDTAPELLPRAVHIINRQTRRLVGLVSELLNVTHISAGPVQLDLAPVDLAAVVGNVADRIGPELRRTRCTLTVRGERSVTGLWDRSRLEQILTNLLSNAMKFGAGRPIEINLQVVDGRARLVVADQGIGIPADQLPRIFDRFSRAVLASHYGGLGLGLHIVTQIVNALGGTVSARSQIGAGAIFTVELPLAGAPLPLPPATAPLQGEERP